jgi:transcriptional regulator with XRE-family HTH domain
MGKSSRSKPERLPEKLLHIREGLDLSQSGLVRHLGLAGKISRAKISEYERGEREPNLVTLLQYARAAGVWVDVLIDDELDLPKKLPCASKHEGIPLKSISKKSSKNS